LQVIFLTKLPSLFKLLPLVAKTGLDPKIALAAPFLKKSVYFFVRPKSSAGFTPEPCLGYNKKIMNPAQQGEL
jgi:hypothetical protein